MIKDTGPTVHGTSMTLELSKRLQNDGTICSFNRRFFFFTKLACLIYQPSVLLEDVCLMMVRGFLIDLK